MIQEYVDLSEGSPDEDDVRDALDYLLSIEPVSLRTQTDGMTPVF